MIFVGAEIQAPSVILLNNYLICSSREMTISCKIDLIQHNINWLVNNCAEDFRRGKESALIYCGGTLREVLNIIESSLQFPLNCQIIQCNKYNRVFCSEQWTADSIADAYRDFSLNSNIKALVLTQITDTFLTSKNCTLTIIPVQAKFSMKTKDFPVNCSNLTFVAKISEQNALQTIHLIGKFNNSLSIQKEKNNLEQLLQIYKDDLSILSRIIEQENYKIEQLINNNDILQKLSNKHK